MRAIAITGPTASGKTALSLAVARDIGCEIISCDSMQIYRGMNIGTAKATAEQMREVRHHLIDIRDPSECFSTEDYRAEALVAARDITARGLVPLFVGGTGLYLDALRRGAQISPPSDAALRAELQRLGESDPQAMWERLNAVDPQSAAAVHANNLRRVVRALEIYELTGKTKTYFDELSRQVPPDIDIGVITIDFHDRDNLYRSVDTRVDAMLDEGLEDEVRHLYSSGMLSEELTAAQAIGYKEMLGYIRGECSLAAAADAVRLASRRYAKRQLTWFRHVGDAVRLYADDEAGRMKSADERIGEAVAAARSLLVTLPDA